MKQWDAEIEVDEALARTLIRERYPQLDTGSLRLLGIGWDNTVWATGDGIAFRFPRRETALAGIEREIALLPQIAPRLPIAVPDAAYPGAPGPRFPWPWFGSRLIEGREIVGYELAEPARIRLAEDLGLFSDAWGELRRAPAAVDLSLYWSLFPPAAREAFRAVYGAMNEATLLRTRVLALFLNAVLAMYARDQGRPGLEAESLDGLERTLR